jgi:hypothetical protein
MATTTMTSAQTTVLTTAAADPAGRIYAHNRSAQGRVCSALEAAGLLTLVDWRGVWTINETGRAALGQ